MREKLRQRGVTLPGTVPIPRLNLSSRIELAGLDLNFVRMNDELSAEAKWFPLQRQVDEVHGFTNLLLAFTVGDLVGVEL
jgi:hypothetical protein